MRFATFNIWVLVCAVILNNILIFLPLTAAAEVVGSSVKQPLAIGSQHFMVELATTDEQMQQGLMFRRHLAEGHGMLFVFEEPRIAAMWMKNTLIPLDMLFIDSEGKIVHIAERATPQSEAVITAAIPVKAVLELAGGTCDKQAIKVGDIVSHAIFHSRTAH